MSVTPHLVSLHSTPATSVTAEAMNPRLGGRSVGGLYDRQEMGWIKAPSQGEGGEGLETGHHSGTLEGQQPLALQLHVSTFYDEALSPPLCVG